MELLELMLWATYEHWKPMAENVMSGNSKKAGIFNLDKKLVAKDFRENLSCVEGVVLRRYLTNG